MSIRRIDKETGIFRITNNEIDTTAEKTPEAKIGKNAFSVNHVDSCATTYDDEISRNSVQMGTKSKSTKNVWTHRMRVKESLIVGDM